MSFLGCKQIKCPFPPTHNPNRADCILNFAVFIPRGAQNSPTPIWGLLLLPVCAPCPLAGLFPSAVKAHLPAKGHQGHTSACEM